MAVAPRRSVGRLYVNKTTPASWKNTTPVGGLAQNKSWCELGVVHLQHMVMGVGRTRAHSTPICSHDGITVMHAYTQAAIIGCHKLRAAVRN
jgi:hypothetical protein